MGSGSWNTRSYATYCCSVGHGYDAKTSTIASNYTSSAQAYVARNIDKYMKPYNVMRECRDSEEHPNTIPIILALDVTGSMGSTAIEVQKKLNPLMNKILEEIKDAELMIMAIGDLSYDDTPIQISQFESDIRIAENLDKIYFENGGGGNDCESYTAAWYMGSRHCDLDCWKRGKKGLIITMGDEPLNPHLPWRKLEILTGDTLQDDVETKDLYEETKKKFDIYHICVKSGCYPQQNRQKKTFTDVIGNQNVLISDVNDISDKIFEIIKDFCGNSKQCIVESFLDDSGNKESDMEEEYTEISDDPNGEISW